MHINEICMPDHMLNIFILAIKRFKTASQARRNFRNFIEICDSHLSRGYNENHKP